MNGSSTGGGRSAWHYIGCGCVALAVLAALVAGGAGWFIYTRARQLKAEITDPAARAAKVRAILDYDRLPDGYHPAFGMSIPWLMEMAILTDRELPAGEDMKGRNGRDFVGDRGFLYFVVRSFQGGRGAARGYARTDFDFDAQETLGEGELEAGGAKVSWVARRGELHRRGEDQPTVAAELHLDCPGDQRERRAVWFTPAPEGGSYAGTPASPEALAAFLGHFRFCR